MSKEELDKKIHSSDRNEALEYSNKILKGEVAVGTKEQLEQQSIPITVATDNQGAIIDPKGDGQVGNGSAIVVDNGSRRGDEGATQEGTPKPKPQEELTEAEKAIKAKLEESEQIAEALRRKRQEDKELYFQKQQEVDNKLSEYEKSVAEYKSTVEKLTKELEEKTKVVEKPKPTIEEDEDIIDAAPAYSKNNRILIESLKQEIEKLSNVVGANNSDKIKILSDKLEAYEIAQEQEKANNAIKQQEEERKRTKQKLFDSIRSFQNKTGNECFQTKTDPEELAEQYRMFRSEVAEMVGSKQPQDINRAIDSLIRGSSNEDKEFRQRAVKEGVKIPEELDKFLMISEVNDIKNGIKYNRITGNFDHIKDEFGRPVIKESLDEAYKVSNYYKKINDIRREAAMNYQKKMDVREDSAVVLDNKQTTTEGEHSAMSKEQLKELLNKPYGLYKNNPKLKEQVEAAYRAVGVQPPVVGRS